MRNCIRIVQFDAGQVKDDELAGHVAGNGRQEVHSHIRRRTWKYKTA